MAVAGIDQGITQSGFEAEAQIFMAIELPAVGEFQAVLGIIFTIIGNRIGGGRGALHDQRVSLDLIRTFITPIPGHAASIRRNVQLIVRTVIIAAVICAAGCRAGIRQWRESAEFPEINGDVESHTITETEFVKFLGRISFQCQTCSRVIGILRLR